MILWTAGHGPDGLGAENLHHLGELLSLNLRHVLESELHVWLSFYLSLSLILAFSTTILRVRFPLSESLLQNYIYST